MKTYLHLLFIFVVLQAIAQGPADVYLDINQVKAFITNDATNFYKATNGNNWDYQGYEVPKGSGKKSEFANSLWICGKDNNQNLRTAAQTFGGSRRDFWPGPLDSNGNSPLNGTAYFINNGFKVNKSSVDSFRIAWQNGAIQNGTYVIPNSISKWPGNNPLHPTESLAPFFDVNIDGIYTPSAGDYPLIKGDQAIFSVFNDKGNNKSGSGSPAMGLEIHRLSYAYQCDSLAPNLDVVNYTTFHEYKIINKGYSAYDSLIVGMMNLGQLGNPEDDYIGSDVQNEVAYRYNSDSIDEDKFSLKGYQNETPIYAYKLLRTAGNDGLDSDGDNIIDEADEKLIREMKGINYFVAGTTCDPIQFGIPNFNKDYYYALNGRYRTGLPLVYGETGIPFMNSENIPSLYCFPGLSDPQNLATNNNQVGPAPVDSFGNSILINGGWYEGNNGQSIPNYPGDKYQVIHARITSLPVGGSRQFNIALIFTPNPQSKNFAALLPQAEQDWQTITTLYENNSLTNNCGTPVNLKTIEKNTNQFKLYPNPSQGQVFITGLKKGKQTLTIQVYDMHGSLVKTHVETTTKDFIQLELKNLDKGLYFIQINNEKLLKVIKAE